MHFLLCLLFFFQLQTAATAPSDADESAILQRVQDYAERYTERLPNFVCSRVVQESRASAPGKRWKQKVKWTERLSIVNGDEQLALAAVNDKQLKPGTHLRPPPLETQGEFGHMLANVFRSDATISWSNWETLNGKRVAVFRYVVDREHSSLRLTTYVTARLAYDGLLYVDPETGVTWRITDSAEIPPELGSRRISTQLDYGDIAIDASRYILPTHAVVVIENFDGMIRNEITYTDYQKFGAKASITFGDSPQ